jgi:hypothetical protein
MVIETIDDGHRPNNAKGVARPRSSIKGGSNEVKFPLLMQHGSTEGAALPTVRLRVGVGDRHGRLRRPAPHVHLQVSAV